MPVVLMALGLAAVAVNRAQGATDNDLWWHLRLGEDFLEQGNLHAPDWSPFATQSWVPTEPVPEVVAAIAHRWAGLDGVMWVYATACVAVVLAIYVGGRAVGRPMAAAIGTLVATIGCSISLTPRPHLVSFVFLTIVLRAWNRTAEDLEPRWYLIPLVFVWSLCHGFWFIGVVYGFLEVVGLLLDRRVAPRAVGPLVAVATLSGLSVLLNPVGLGVFEAPFAVNEVRKYASEWEHTTPTMLAVFVVLGMQLAVVALWSRHRRLWSWRRLLLLLSSVFWLWFAWRTVVLASVVTAPLLVEGLEAALRRATPAEAADRADPSPRAEFAVLGGWALACAAALVALVPALYHPPPTDSAIDRRLDRLPPGSVVFNQFDVGGYLTWRHPDLHPVIDGLITPYSPAYVDEYFRARNLSPGWHRFFDATGAKAALLLDDSRLADVLEQEGWTATARFHDYVLLQRTGTS
jgi:hypothetical protein